MKKPARPGHRSASRSRCIATSLGATFFAGTMLFTPVAVAQQDESQRELGLGAKVGTTGLGLELSTPLADRVNLRLGYNFLEFDYDFDTDDVDYDGDIQKSAISAMADWHPWDTGFRISAGALYHFDNRLDVIGRLNTTETYEFNNTIYDTEDVGPLDGRARYDKTSPYIGIGWGNAAEIGNSLGFVLELGLIYQGSPEVNLAANECDLPLNLCTMLTADLQAEEAELEDDLDNYKWWPVLNIGLSFKL